MTDTDAAVVFLAHDGLKQTQILKQNKSQNHMLAQIGRLVTAMQTKMHNFGTTPPKTLDNWDYRPTTCKLNVTLLLSADSSEKKNTPLVASDQTQLNVLHYSTFTQETHLLLHLLPWWVTMDSMCRGEKRNSSGKWSTALTPVAPVCRARQMWWLSRFQCPAFCFPPCWYSVPP